MATVAAVIASTGHLSLELGGPRQFGQFSARTFRTPAQIARMKRARRIEDSLVERDKFTGR